MVMGPIPWTAIVQWCAFHDLDAEATKIMVQVIRQLDNDRAEADAARRRIEAAAGPHGGGA